MREHKKSKVLEEMTIFLHLLGLIGRIRERRGKHLVRTAKQRMSRMCSTSNREGGLLLAAALVLQVCNVAGVAPLVTSDVLLVVRGYSRHKRRLAGEDVVAVPTYAFSY